MLFEQLTADKEALALAAPLGIAFAKHLGHLYLPLLSPAADTSTHDFPTLAQASEGEPEDAIVTREVKDKFRKLLLAYLDALGRREGRDHVVRPLLAARGGTADTIFERRSCRSRTSGITRLIFAAGKSLRTGRRTTRRACEPGSEAGPA